MVKILQKDSPVLRTRAKAVSKSEFTTKELNKIIADMANALEKEHDGVALAAPQIGISKRIFVVSHRAFEAEKISKDPKATAHVGKDKEYADLVCINPEILTISKDRKLVPEGCLSVRWLYGNTRRASRVKMKAQDATGKEFTITGASLLAQIFQHEVDHLNGILFTDHAKDIQDLPPTDLIK